MSTSIIRGDDAVDSANIIQKDSAGKTALGDVGTLGGLANLVVQQPSSGNVNIALLNKTNDAYAYMYHDGNAVNIVSLYDNVAGCKPIKLTVGANTLTYDANGNLLVGTSTDNGVDKLQVNGSIVSSGGVRFVSDLNGISGTGGFLTGDFAWDSTAFNAPCAYGTVHQISRMGSECTQMAQDILSNSLFIRRFVAGAWQPWRTI